MKIYLTIILFLFVSQTVQSQSPYLSIKISAHENLSTYPVTYDYDLKLYLPENFSTSGNAFEPDISLLNPEALPDEYFGGLRKLHLKSEEVEYYRFSDQMVPYEGICNLSIMRHQKNETKSMQIVFFINRKSFVTDLDLRNIEFKTGLFDLTNELEYEYVSDSRLNIKPKKTIHLTETEENNLWIE